MKKLFKAIIFLIIFVLLLTLVNKVLIRKEMIYIKQFFNQKKYTIDVVFLGSSHNFETVNPLIVWKESKINSYVLGTPLQPIQMSYFYLIEALKNQKIKLVVLETFLIRIGKTYVDGMTLSNGIDPLPFSINKIKMINELVPKNERINYYFNVVKYHNRWREVNDLDFNHSEFKMNDPLRGYKILFGNDEKVEINHNIVNEEIIELYNYDLEFFDKIFNLCKKNDIELLLYEAPYIMDETNVKISNSIAKLAMEKNINFISAYKFIDNLSLDSIDFYNKGHLNYIGSEKVSKYLAKYIKEKYNINTNHSEDIINSFEKDIDYYENLISN